MANVSWQITGDCFGNCTCDYMRCPCPSSNFREVPNRGWCKFALVFHIISGHFDKLPLDDLCIAVAGWAPGIMGDGNWSLGLIVDERANAEQQQALAGIMGGQFGSPMASMAPWVSKFLGMAVKPFKFEKNGMNYSVSVPEMLEFVTEGTPGANPNEPVYFENSPHPVNTRIGMGKATKSRVRIFDIEWDGTGADFGVLCQFDWKVN